MPFAEPMLAGKIKLVDLPKVQFAVYGQPKLDGNRMMVQGGQPISRKGKLFPNRKLQEWVARYAHVLDGMDGELIVGEPWAHDACRRTTSVVMSFDKVNDVHFYVYDLISMPGATYTSRWAELHRRVSEAELPGLCLVDSQLLTGEDALVRFETEMLAKGYEGVILRAPDAAYKHGRSTVKKGELLALKRFEDTEAEVIGFAEEMRNDNEQTRDAFGSAKRSTHKANLTGKGMLGALRCRGLPGTPFAGLEFDIGSGFDDATATQLWAERDSLAGRLVKFQYFAAGVKELPRFPVFLCFRDPIDMSAAA